MLKRAVSTAASAVAVLALGILPAQADGGKDDCPTNDSYLCKDKETPKTPGNESGGGSGGSGGGAPQCTQNGETVPCSLPGRGFFYQGCYWQLASPPPPPDHMGWSGHKPGDPGGAMYNPTFCYTGDEGYMGSPLWLPIPATTMSPEELARRALSKIRLDAPPVHLTPGPGATGLVSLPVWLWTEANAHTWGPIQNSDSDGPLTVTLTAKVSKIVWTMGDGGSVTCTQPGVPYSPSYNDQPSPQCGYAYQHTSKGQPGEAFTVTATTYWDASWTASTGDSGSIPGVTRSTTVGNIKVGELQVVNGG